MNAHIPPAPSASASHDDNPSSPLTGEYSYRIVPDGDSGWWIERGHVRDGQWWYQPAFKEWFATYREARENAQKKNADLLDRDGLNAV